MSLRSTSQEISDAFRALARGGFEGVGLGGGGWLGWVGWVGGGGGGAF